MLKWFAAGAAVLTAVIPFALLLAAAAGTVPAESPALSGGPSLTALQDIPPGYLALYMAAAQSCPGLPWGVLAGIGKVESDHGRSTAPGVHSGHNYAGAEGPMQFEPATFTRYATDGDHDGLLSPYDPGDAIPTAAAMLCADGAQGGASAGLRRAVFAYNHSDSYVTSVLGWAARYTIPDPTGPAAAAIAFALRQVGKPYQWGAAGPDAFDCSGLVWAAYASAGIHIARTTFQWRQDGPQVPLTQLQPGDLIFYPGSDGTPANPGHVVMYLGGGLIIQAPQTGENVQTDPLDLAGAVAATRPSGLAHHP